MNDKTKQTTYKTNIQMIAFIQERALEIDDALISNLEKNRLVRQDLQTKRAVYSAMLHFIANNCE